MKNLELLEVSELNLMEVRSISGGLYPITRAILEVAGAIADEMKYQMKDNKNWWMAFAH